MPFVAGNGKFSNRVRGFNSAVITAVLIFIACWDFLNFCLESILTIIQPFEKSSNLRLSTADARYIGVEVSNCVKAFSHDKPKSYNGSFDDLLTMFYVFFASSSSHMLQAAPHIHKMFEKKIPRRIRYQHFFSIFKADLRRHRPEHKRTKESREKKTKRKINCLLSILCFFFLSSREYF